MEIGIVPIVLGGVSFVAMALGQNPDKGWAKLSLIIAGLAVICQLIGVTPEQLALMKH